MEDFVLHNVDLNGIPNVFFSAVQAHLEVLILTRLNLESLPET